MFPTSLSAAGADVSGKEVAQPSARDKSRGYRKRRNRREESSPGGRQPEKRRTIRRKLNDERQKIKSMFRTAKDMERTGRWKEASALLDQILAIDPRDSHSHLALARLESRRENSMNYRTQQHKNGRSPEKDGVKDAVGRNDVRASRAREAFSRGTEMCPESVHLWQAWALHEQGRGDLDRARELYEKALSLDDCNPYVFHAFGLMEQRRGNVKRAQELWEQALTRRSTAALICSLGELYVSIGRPDAARDIYAKHVHQLTSEREMTEVYLAAAWLEEKHYKDRDRAAELINMALQQSPGNSRAHVALARLEGRRERLRDKSGTNAALRKRLEEACEMASNRETASVNDGRLHNALANIEVKSGHLSTARKVLKQGIRRFPKDQSLLQAAGKVEERDGNYTGARDLYAASLHVEPSAPTLVAYAMLEMRHPEKKPPDLQFVKRLFEEALLLEPRHGPAYNAYGNMEMRRGNVDAARAIFHRGVQAHCTDAASVYHGLARLELSLGNVEIAREVLINGLQEVERHEGMMDSSQHKRALFLVHTLGMLELKSNRATEAQSTFESGIARYGNSSQLLLGAALCEVKLGKDDSARELFERAVNADQKHAQAWQAWGVMEMRAGDITVAKTLFECGIQNAPSHGALWQAYATMESRAGHFDVARTLFAAGVKKCPRHVPLYQAWACLEMRGGNFDRAKTLIGEALTRDRTLGSGWLVAAKIEEKQGNDGIVGLILQRGLDYAPNDAELYCALAEFEIKHGKIDDARKLLEKGLEVDPLHAPLYHSLAELEARVFNIDGLAKLNKRAAEVFNNNALVSSPASMQALGKKIKMGRSKNLPDGVAALAQKSGHYLDMDDALTNMDPMSIIDNMKEFQDHDVGSIFNVEEDVRNMPDAGADAGRDIQQQ